jgi:hypothetical protein
LLTASVIYLSSFKGSFEDQEAVAKAFEGVYGVWVNTDGFTVGEIREIVGFASPLSSYCCCSSYPNPNQNAGMLIFESAKRAGSLRHFVWSSVPYASKVIIVTPCRLAIKSLITLSPHS